MTHTCNTIIHFTSQYTIVDVTANKAETCFTYLHLISFQHITIPYEESKLPTLI